MYLDQRLKSRKTYVEWDHQMMGPINDKMGVEQGGCASDRLYQLTNDEQLETAQRSELGVDMGLVVDSNNNIVKQILSAVGQADDVGLLSSCLHSLKCLLQLTEMYCSKYHVHLVSSKTKLLAFSPKNLSEQTRLDLSVIDIVVDNEIVTPTPHAAHVGVVRSTEGNGPTC